MNETGDGRTAGTATISHGKWENNIHTRLAQRSRIGRAIEVHRQLGPGLLESTYEECLCWELREAGVGINRQVSVPILYKGKPIAAAYRLDLIVEQRIIVEIKAVDRLAPVHEAQLLTYLKHTGISTGLLFNFNTPVLRDGMRRLSF
ncbi:MAG TPA: GxxExxY protein [Gemmatimonadaceae bacterium]